MKDVETKNSKLSYEYLQNRFEQAAKNMEDELDFFLGLVEEGITLDDIKRFLPEKYEYSRIFMEEHGLV